MKTLYTFQAMFALHQQYTADTSVLIHNTYINSHTDKRQKKDSSIVYNPHKHTQGYGYQTKIHALFKEYTKQENVSKKSYTLELCMYIWSVIQGSTSQGQDLTPKAIPIYKCHKNSSDSQVLTHWGRVTQICVFNTRLFSLHNILNYAMHRVFLRMVLLTDVYRNLTSL